VEQRPTQTTSFDPPNSLILGAGVLGERQREGISIQERPLSFGALGDSPAGVYFGTTGGILFASRDGGAHWSAIAEGLPRIQSVQVSRIAS
jgi:hypothetical protein